MHFLRTGALVLTLAAAPAAAIEPFVIKDIRVEGIQRTEAGTVFSYLPVKVGDTMTDEKAAESLRALFATGFFKDVTLEAQDSVLIVSVQERPSIAQVDFVGMKEFDKETVVKALSQVGLAEGRIFDKSLLDRAEQELKRPVLESWQVRNQRHDHSHSARSVTASLSTSISRNARSQKSPFASSAALVSRRKICLAFFQRTANRDHDVIQQGGPVFAPELSADLETCFSN